MESVSHYKRLRIFECFHELLGDILMVLPHEIAK